MLVYVPRALVGCVSIRFCAVFLLLRKVVLAFNSHFQQKNVVQRRLVKAQDSSQSTVELFNSKDKGEDL